MPKCVVCEKTIRGNAAREWYDEMLQLMKFVCNSCEKKMTPNAEGFKKFLEVFNK